jgi:phage-related holin
MWESLRTTMENTVKAWPALVVAGVCSLWAGLGIVLQALLLAMGLDVVAGIVKKVLTLLVVALAVLIEPMLQEAVQAALGVSVHIPIGETVTIFFIAIEGLNITENAGEAGVPIPGILRNALEKLRAQADAELVGGSGGPVAAPMSCRHCGCEVVEMNVDYAPKGRLRIEW